MKKIRLLAILLAMLMIPFSMFFACDNTEDPENEEEEEEGDNEGDDPTSNPTRPIVMDNDGTNIDGGYLMYFHFNAAGDGKLNIIEPSADASSAESEYVLEAPYSTYLSGSSVVGGNYVVRTAGGESFLAIERDAVSSNPTLKIKVKEAFSSDIDADHVLQFKLYFEEGFFGAPVNVYASKGSNKLTYLTVENGAIKDGNGNVVYGEKADDKRGWITVSIVISEQSRVYDLYIDGIRQTTSVEFPSDYPSWNTQIDSYCIEISRSSKGRTLCYIDNLSMRNGDETGIYKGDDGKLVYTDEVSSYYSLFSPSKDSVLGELGKNVNNGGVSGKIVNSLKTEVFSSKLLMSNYFTLSKITLAENASDDVVEDVMQDYGVEKGYYDEVSYFYKDGSDDYFSTWIVPVTDGADYDSANVKYVGKIAYDENKKDANPAVEGTYTIGEGDVITFNWGEFDWGEAAAPQYAKYNAGTLTLYTDETCATAVDGGAYSLYSDTEEYANVKYSTVGAADSVAIEISPFFGTAKLSITPAAGDAIDGVYPYTVDGGVVTVTVEGTPYTFTYDDEDNTFVYGTDTVLNKVVENETLGANERYAAKWSNFGTGGIRFFTYVDTEKWADIYQDYNKIRFEFYADKKLCKDGFRFMLILGCGANYYPVYLDSDITTVGEYYKYSPGWNVIELDILEAFAAGIQTDIVNLDSVYLAVTGWKNGPTTDPNGKDGPNDGYNIYIGDIALVKTADVEVQGPDDQHAKCTHTSGGASTWVDVAEPIEANCEHGQYYIQRCSVCGATRYDDSRPAGKSLPHNFNRTDIYTVEPTCITDGYEYYECLDCGFRFKTKIFHALGHFYEETVDRNKRIVRTYCRPCGYSKEKIFYEALIPMSQKINDTNFEAYFVVDADEQINTKVNFNGNPTAYFGSLVNKGIGGTIRYATVKTVEVGGRSALEVKPIPAPSGASTHTYINVGVGDRTIDFVVEVEVMLGAKTNDGKYSGSSISVVDNAHPDGVRRDFTVMSIDENGVVMLNCISGTSPTYQLTDTEFTNIAVAISTYQNTAALYIDGNLIGEPMPFKGNANHRNAADVIVNSFRYNFTALLNATTYIGGFGWYEAEEPVCVIYNGPAVKEPSKPIILKDEDGYDLRDTFNVKSIDVMASLAVDMYASKYVMDFTLNGANLDDGTILEGIKLGTGYIRTEALISVKNGRLYCGDREIIATTENVRIALAIDDTIGAIDVYVNGQYIGETISYSKDEYNDVLARFRGIIFYNDCGEYTVSGLKMYTGEYVA